MCSIMTTWFCADPHIGHKFVAQLRGFTMPDQDGVDVADAELHDMTIADNWDSAVKPEDEVWILGDVSMSSGPYVLDWIDARPGIKHLVSGNHDKTHTGIFPERKSRPVNIQWKPHFASIQNEATLTIAGKKVTLSHFPYWSWGDGPNVKDPDFVPRYKEFRPKETKTSILLHGHTHTKDRAHERSLHVGLDAWGLQLVPMTVVEEFVRNLP